MRDQPLDPDREERFRALVSKVIDPVRGYLVRRSDPVTVEDILAETLTVLWRRLDAVPAEAPVAWSIGVARLQLRNAERSERRQVRLVQRILSLDPPIPVTPAEVSEEADVAVQRVLSRMSERDAEVLRLWVWDELEPGRIAMVLGITSNAASIRLHRAKKRFGELYRKEQGSLGHDEVKEGGGR